MSKEHIADILVAAGTGILFGIIITFAPNKITAMGISVLIAIGMFVASWSVLRIKDN